MKTIRPKAEQAIIEAGFIQLNENPKASLANIAQQAGVGRATLHRHFTSRDDLIHAMARQAMQEMDDAADQASQHCNSYSSALEQIFKAMIPLGVRHWFISNESLSDLPDIAAKLKQQEQELKGLIKRCKKEGLFSADWSNDWIIQVFDHMIHAAWTLLKEDQATLQQASTWAWGTLINGLQSGASS